MKKSKVVLITGATSGIGLQLARRYKARGFQLVLTGRRSLRNLPQDLFNKDNYCEVELTDKGCINKLNEFLESYGVTKLDLLVHNAGIGWFGDLVEQSSQSVEKIITVNTKVPIALSRSLLPIIRNASGKIIFISSVTANLPCKDFAAYAASKAAIDGFARSLRVELKDKVEVLLVEPGGTKTDMHSKAGIPDDKINPSNFHTAEEVAKAIEIAELKNTKRSTLGYQNYIASLAGRKFPGIIAALAK